MINDALVLIVDRLPRNIAKKIRKIENSTDIYSIENFTFSKIRDVQAMISICKRRLKSKIDNNTKLNLEKKLRFLIQLENSDIVWHGYAVEGKIRKYFLVSLKKKIYIELEDYIEN